MHRVIDTGTKEALIAEDPKSVRILKPVLRRRDIRRYQADWAGLWLIDTHNGYGDVPAIEIDEYPAVKDHLKNFYARLERRYDKGSTPYNLRNCAYHEDFKKEKLLWIDLTEQGRFAYDAGDIFCVNSAYMLTGPSIKYLCAVLNSSIATWFMKSSALNSGMGTTRWVRFTVDRIPIPKIGPARERLFVKSVDRILGATETNSKADTSGLEGELDGLVNELYGLTDDEVQAIVSKVANT